jgi:hypothetical protein
VEERKRTRKRMIRISKYISVPDTKRAGAHLERCQDILTKLQSGKYLLVETILSEINLTHKNGETTKVSRTDVYSLLDRGLLRCEPEHDPVSSIIAEFKEVP